jgi:DNA polymerase III subunit epsilon
MMPRRSHYQPSDTDRSRVRADAVAWALAVTRDCRTVYLDTETTGLDSSAEIIEISILDGAGNVLMDTLVRPRLRIPRDAQAIHGISNEMVAGAPAWSDVYAEVLSVLGDRVVIVYNAEFDFRMVSQMNLRDGLRTCPGGWQCAMQRYSGFAGDWHERYGNYRWHKLDRALASFGHPPAGHRALADASACRLVVEGIAAG